MQYFCMTVTQTFSDLEIGGVIYDVEASVDLNYSDDSFAHEFGVEEAHSFDPQIDSIDKVTAFDEEGRGEDLEITEYLTLLMTKHIELDTLDCDELAEEWAESQY